MDDDSRTLIEQSRQLVEAARAVVEQSRRIRAHAEHNTRRSQQAVDSARDRSTAPAVKKPSHEPGS